MRTGWLIAAFGFILLAAFALRESLSYPVADPLGPGPGFFPLILSILTGSLALAVVAQVAWRRGPSLGQHSILPRGAEAHRVLFVLVGLVFIVAALRPLGFRLTMLAFLIYLPLSLGARNMIAVSALALTGSFGVFHVFYYWLKVPLPIGSLGI